MFEDIQIAPFFAVETIDKKSMSVHREYLYDNQMYPVCFVSDLKNEVVKPFLGDDTFKVAGVFINIMYSRTWDA